MVVDIALGIVLAVIILIGLAIFIPLFFGVLLGAIFSKSPDEAPPGMFTNNSKYAPAQPSIPNTISPFSKGRTKSGLVFFQYTTTQPQPERIVAFVDLSDGTSRAERIVSVNVQPFSLLAINGFPPEFPFSGQSIGQVVTEVAEDYERKLHRKSS